MRASAYASRNEVYTLVELRTPPGLPMHARLVSEASGERLLLAASVLDDATKWRRAASSPDPRS